MSKVRQIIKLHSQGIGKRKIGMRLGIVKKYSKTLRWPVFGSETASRLEEKISAFVLFLLRAEYFNPLKII